MTVLSINLNKIALLRNSRGHDYPNVVEFAKRYLALGVQGLTIHPRPDERHITRRDAYDLGELVSENKSIELNIEGYPSEDFIALVKDIEPAQCTLVPDEPGQLTSDHGWDLTKQLDQVRDACTQLNAAGIRSAIFMDPDKSQIELAPASGAQRIELYTEEYAATYGDQASDAVFNKYADAASFAQQVGLGVNAGHDLNLVNLEKFLLIDNILEVSIGHALTVECIENGIQHVVTRYLDICRQAR